MVNKIIREALSSDKKIFKFQEKRKKDARKANHSPSSEVVEEVSHLKYEGFELYIRIAHDVHSAVPREQLVKPVFQKFIYNDKTEEKVYALGI